MSVDHAWPYLKRTQLQCVICTHVCEQPALVCHGQQLPCVRRLCSSGFTPMLRSAVALHRRDSGLGISHARNYRGSRLFGLHEIFKCGHLKFIVYGHKQASRHTHNFRKCSHASVGLAQARPNYVVNTTTYYW